MTITDALSVGEAKPGHGCSTEEENQLIRSTKKIKSIEGIEDATMVENQSVGGENLGVMANPVALDVLMNEKGLSEVLGIPLKIDINTAMASRGKYARVCIEMDLQKPLVFQFAIGKNIYLVEYEHLHSVCFYCGRVGHVKEVCHDKLVMKGIKQWQQLTEGENQMEEPAGANGLGSSRVKDVGEISQAQYGPWMKITNQRKINKDPRLQKGATYQQGNRFRSLQEEKEQGAQTTQPGKDKEPMHLVSLELGFKYKVKTKGIDANREGRGNQLEID
ncbi:hypothetical protein LOK49_LG10G00977 [Camellia lanceoleosa]|uniref:Uncharacterized protein n=1 Tax=Camellia lanceoleosa TaxID=1840588 RepID=A0ACC0GC24_9ERIC|nr:hypothetical protein LOK49_LG10G00977 [Camellia lanceoleosa]